MRRALVAGAVVSAAAVAIVSLAIAGGSDDDRVAAGRRAFADVARVLQSPRCMNCHPTGDRPLQGDDSHFHRMNISRATVAAGVPCSTCHQTHNSETVGVAGGPPGAPNWHLPAADMPLVFQGRSVPALCAQLKDPAQNGHRTLQQLLDHVTGDPLVLWGWSPGGKRTLPPLSHDAFVAAFTAWVASDGACP